ncbi:hypothetical protein AAC387_Pa11g0818 [Persea americana]
MKHGIFISQVKYIKEMLKRFTMEDSKPVSTPMSTNTKLSRDDKAPSVDHSTYRSMIGSLLYLTATRPDILQAICMVARFQASPAEAHLTAVKRIFRYLKGTMELGIWYPKGKSFILVAYSDTDWAGCVDDLKSTSGGAFFLECVQVQKCAECVQVQKCAECVQVQKCAEVYILQKCAEICGRRDTLEMCRDVQVRTLFMYARSSQKTVCKVISMELVAACFVVHSCSVEDGFALADGPVATVVVVYTVAEGLVTGVALAGFEQPVLLVVADSAYYLV